MNHQPVYKPHGLEEHKFLGHTAGVDVYQHGTLPNFFFARWGDGKQQREFFQRAELDSKKFHQRLPKRRVDWINPVRTLLEMEGFTHG